MRYIVVGAGIIGLATAYKLLLAQPGSIVTVLEKEPGPGRHQSGNNSGVLHAGLYYQPGSFKARLTITGLRELVRFCEEHGIRHEICGKIVVATNERELSQLKELATRGAANGLQGLKMLAREEMLEIEPHVGGITGLHVSEEGIVDYPAVCAALVRQTEKLGGAIKFNCAVERAEKRGDVWLLHTSTGPVETDFVITCAGLHSDRIAALFGVRPAARIIPFRGEYYQLKPERQALVRHLIYPVPDLTFPFLGVHFTRLIAGGIEAGPNAVLAFSREGYRPQDINLRDLGGALAFPGLWRFLHRHRAMCWYEFRRSLSREAFCAALQKLVPSIRTEDLMPGGAGVRAQAMTADGHLVQDFEFASGPGSLHVVNAPSPGATASLAIGSEIVRRVLSLA